MLKTPPKANIEKKLPAFLCNPLSICIILLVLLVSYPDQWAKSALLGQSMSE